MIRPQSIITFERCYLAALAINIANAVMNWSRMQSSPMHHGITAFGGWYMALMAALFAIPLILWYLVARRRSVVAKWFVVAIFVFVGLAGITMALTMGTLAPGLGGILTSISIILQMIAVTSLFKPDTKTWFGEKSFTGGPEV